MSRADRVAARLAGHDLDLLLVTDLVNVRYLTGYTGTNGLAILGAQTRRFLTDFRYTEQAEAQVTAGFDRETAPRELRLGLADGWPSGPVRLGFEDDHLPVRALAALRETLPGRVELVPAGGLVEAERAIKEPEEIAAIRAAAALTDEIYEWVAGRGVVGRTERELAITLEHEMRLRGAEPAFASIVASGEHGAQPHAVPRDVPVAARRAGHAGHRRPRRRLLLGLHADLGDRPAAGRARGDPRRRGRRGGGGGRGRPPGPHGARGGRGRARRRGGRGPRRALRPRARPRRRPRDPRGPATGADRRDAAGRGPRGHGGAGRLRARRRRGAGGGPRAGHRGRSRGAQRHDAGAMGSSPDRRGRAQAGVAPGRYRARWNFEHASAQFRAGPP